METLTTRPDSMLVQTERVPWKPLGPSTSYKLLRASVETGAFTVMLRVEAGGFFLAHKHLGAADFYVLQGRLEYEGGTAVAGDWIYEPNGSVHEMTVCKEETVVLFHFHGPVAFLGPFGGVRMIVDSQFVLSQARGAGSWWKGPQWL